MGDDDFIVHFFQKDFLKEALKGEVADLSKGSEIIFTLWAESRKEADAWAEEVRKAGGTIFSEPEAMGKVIMALAFQTLTGINGMCFICNADLNRVRVSF